MTAVLLAHLAAASIAPWLVSILRRRAFFLFGLLPLVTTIWASVRLGAALDGEGPTETLDWVPDLGLILGLRLTPIGALMTLLVAGIGTLIFVYSYGYFSDDSHGLGRFTATLLVFSAAMLGLVWSSTIWALFLFWEATSITSFLLVGQKYTDTGARRAARRALLITVGGGLALMGGLVILWIETGTVFISEMGRLTGGGLASAVAVLVMLGAATKSAQVPFHVWLPGAMAAPTPVSAYLHSATMVKAGVLLVAVMGPVLASTDAWRPLGLLFGLTSLVWGAAQALRQIDLKLILAWGTVSQLGLLVTLFSIGTAKATFAGVAMLLAHAIFKAALFIVAGEIDVRTGTRKITELSGLARSMPLAMVTAVVAGMSMAGIPPTLGFVAKEAAVESVLKLEGGEGVFIAGSVIVGSILTVAYTTRLLIGAFGRSGAETVVTRGSWALALPSTLLAAVTVLGFVFLGPIDDLVGTVATALDGEAAVYNLHRWPGLTAAFLTSLFIVTVGIAIGAALLGWQRRTRPEAPPARGAHVADLGIDGLVVGARRVAAVVQHGSLPLYLLTAAFVTALAILPMITDRSTIDLRLSDSPSQAALALLAALSAAMTVTMRTRLSAAIGLGAVGVAVTGLFVAHGGADLALTQLLVETVVVVGFVLGFGRLPRRFPEVSAVWRTLRLTLSLLVGGGVALALAVAGSSPTRQAPKDELLAVAEPLGGGKNVVNVILTDVRALDTLGEVLVLLVSAVGVLALMRSRRPGGVDPVALPAPQSPLARTGVQATTPFAVVLAAYLLFAGHNHPGGGFAAGLVIGAVLALRCLTGIQRPDHAVGVLGLGGLLAVGTAMVPMLYGEPFLDQSFTSFEVPLLGTVKIGMALPFDIGVTMIVVGLVLAVLDGFDVTSLAGRDSSDEPVGEPA